MPRTTDKLVPLVGVGLLEEEDKDTQCLGPRQEGISILETKQEIRIQPVLAAAQRIPPRTGSTIRSTSSQESHIVVGANNSRARAIHTASRDPTDSRLDVECMRARAKIWSQSVVQEDEVGGITCFGGLRC